MTPDEVIKEWAKILSLDSSTAKKKIGGINNHVYELQRGKKKLVLKIYNMVK